MPAALSRRHQPPDRWGVRPISTSWRTVKGNGIASSCGTTATRLAISWRGRECERHPGQPDLARLRAERAAEQAQQRRLPAAIGADDRRQVPRRS